MTRKERIDEAIARADLDELSAIVRGRLCACRGLVDGEELCVCEANRRQVMSVYSYPMMRRGKLVRLKKLS